MYDFVLVDLFIAIEELGHVEIGFALGEFGFNDLVHVWGAEFSDEIGVVFGGEYIKKSEYVGFIFEFLKNINFRLKQNAIDFVFEHFKIDHLDSNGDIYR